MIHTYSTIGPRTRTDFMVWRIGYELDPFQSMTARLNKTEMGEVPRADAVISLDDQALDVHRQGQS